MLPLSLHGNRYITELTPLILFYFGIIVIIFRLCKADRVVYVIIYMLLSAENLINIYIQTKCCVFLPDILFDQLFIRRSGFSFRNASYIELISIVLSLHIQTFSMSIKKSSFDTLLCCKNPLIILLVLKYSGITFLKNFSSCNHIIGCLTQMLCCKTNRSVFNFVHLQSYC